MVALALGEPGAPAVDRWLALHERRVASSLLEAEVHSALRRERLKPAHGLLEPIEWIMPDRPLTREIEFSLAAGYLRGSDLWHVACALYASAGRSEEMTFLTLDIRQRVVAAKLGFATRGFTPE